MHSLLSYTTLTVITVDLLATSGDITMTWTSPMYSKLYSNDSLINPLSRPITKNEDAFIASLINIGAILGGVPFSYLADYYGRKISLLTIGIFHIIAYLAMAFATNIYLLYFGRLFGGLAVGGGYTLLPIYIAEVADEPKRGFYSVTLTIFWATGNFLPYVVGPFFNVQVFNLFNAIFPIIFCILFFIFGTESPIYLVGANKLEEAEIVLMKLRSQDKLGVQIELKQIKDTLKQEEGSVSFTNIFTNRGLRKGFIVSLSLISFQQLCGWNAITFYLQPIFESSGNVLPSEYSSIVIGAAILIFSLPSPVFADKFGRKTLLIFSSGLTGLSLMLLGIFYFIESNGIINTEPINWIPLTSILVLVFAYQAGLACLPWTVSSELFPTNVKKISASASSASCWIASFLMTQFFNDMTEGLGKAGTFFMFAFFAFACVVFTTFYVPETKGKTFKEIQCLLQSK